MEMFENAIDTKIWRNQVAKNDKIMYKDSVRRWLFVILWAYASSANHIKYLKSVCVLPLSPDERDKNLWCYLSCRQVWQTVY